MSVARLAIVSCALLASCATTPSPRETDARSLARAEAAFAAQSAADGMKAAFMDAMSDDATLFRPGPVNGRQWMGQRPEPPIVLEWKPQRTMVAKSGELGFSTGPSKITPRAEPGRAEFGQFFSVWRKNAEGRWQVLIDHGITMPQPFGWDRALETVDVDPGPRPAETIADAETRFAAACERDGLAPAYRAFASRYLRLLRDGQVPADGAASVDAVAALPSSAARWTWTPTDSGASTSYDLAWTMGRYRWRDAGGTTRIGYYVRAWRAESGAWRIVADVLAPQDPAAR